MDTAIARSKLPSVLGISAGARLIVIRFRGSLSELLANELRMRSFASSTALLAEPTITILGKLFEVWHSTSTSVFWPPLATLYTTSLMAVLYSGFCICQLWGQKKEQRPASSRCSEEISFFVFEHFFYSSAMFILIKCNSTCQCLFLKNVTDPVYNFCGQ